MPDAALPDWINGDPADLRLWRNARPEAVDPVLPEDVAIAPLAPDGACPGGLRLSPQSTAGLPTVYFHGGGFIVGSPETHRGVAAWIAHLAKAPVYSIRYRLAPEHPLPAQAQDGVAAVRRALRHHHRLRLMGDSAGALVALWAHAGLTPDELARIADVTLFYPGGLPVAPPPLTGDETDGLGPLSLASYRRRLDPAGIAPGNPALDPLAPGFPLPAGLVVLAAGADPLLPEAMALAALPGARLFIAQGQPHGFLHALPDPMIMGHLAQAIEDAR
jgi:acetyl esterase